MVTFEIHSPYILPTYDIRLEQILCSLLLLFTSEDMCLNQDHIYYFSFCLIIIDIVSCWSYIFS